MVAELTQIRRHTLAGPPRAAGKGPVGRAVLIVAATAASSALSAWLVGIAVSAIAPNKMAFWLLARAAGVSSYLLIVALVCFGLFLSHPSAARARRPSPAFRLRVHVSLAVFTLVFTVLHIVALASDRYAGVGWRGVFVPGLAAYRPLPVSLGVIGLYAGLLAGLTAATAGRFAGRAWWPIHKVAIVSLVLVWVHGVLAGSDTPALLVMYIATGALIVGLAVSRYTARTPVDRVQELLAQENRAEVRR